MMVLLVVLVGLAGLLILEKLSRERFCWGILITASFLTGSVINAVIMLMSVLFFGGWRREIILGLEALFVLVNFWWCRERFRSITLEITKPIAITLLVILLQAGFLGYSQLTNDYLHSDGLSLWFMRGKLFFLDQGVSSTSMNSLILRSVNRGPVGPRTQSLAKYPPLVSLNVAWVYLVQNREAVMPAKELWLGVMLTIELFLLVIGRELFGGKSGKMVAMPILAIFTPVMWTHFTPHWFGAADLWLSAFYLLGIGVLYFWLTLGTKNYLWLGALLLAGATLTKIEGAVALAGLLVILVAKRKQFWWPGRVIVAGLMILPMVMWFWLTLRLKIQDDYLIQLLQRLVLWPTLLGRMGLTIQVLGQQFLAVDRYLLLWPVAMGIALVSWRKWRWRQWCWLYLLPITGWAFMFVSYAFNYLDFNELVYASLPRVYSQWVPTAIMLSGIAIAYFGGDKKINKVKIAKR